MLDKSDLQPMLLIIIICLFFIFIMGLIGRLRLSKITHTSPLLGLEFERERFDLNDKLSSKLKSFKFELMNQKQSELTKMHDKLRNTNLNDSNLAIFPSDTQNIMFEMSDETSDDCMSDDVSLSTDTFEMENANPIPITMRLSIKR